VSLVGAWQICSGGSRQPLTIVSGTGGGSISAWLVLSDEVRGTLVRVAVVCMGLGLGLLGLQLFSERMGPEAKHE